MSEVQSGGWNLESTYAALPDSLHVAVHPVVPHDPRLLVLNEPLCTELGLDAAALRGRAGAEMLSGYRLPPGAKPIAQAYAGHQFGHFAILGDGRAVLLGEQLTPQGTRYDVQLKGAGPTPYSRGGDGFAALKPMLREYLMGEAMHALGVPTTRSLAVVGTGSLVRRESLLAGAVLARIACSHIRVGTFEYAAATGDLPLLSSLVNYTWSRHFALDGQPGSALELLRAVCTRQAKLVAKWQMVGFVHGVMNTDNMAVSGETIDYGPCAFLDGHNPDAVFSSIDRAGRYAYGQQPRIMFWNLERFAAALLPLIAQSAQPGGADAVGLARQVLEDAVVFYDGQWLTGMGAKIGLAAATEGDRGLVLELVALMKSHKADHTNTFLQLQQLLDQSGASDGLGRNPVAHSDSGQEAMFVHPDFVQWQVNWTARLAQGNGTASEILDLMKRVNPAVVPRNHRVEMVLDSAARGDMGPFFEMNQILESPYSHRPVDQEWCEPAPAGAPPHRTFCGT